MAPISPQGQIAVGVCTALTVLASTAVGLRFAARKKRGLAFEIDDWITLLGLFFVYCMYISWIIFAVDLYEGFHIDQLTPEQIELCLKGLFAVQLTYTFAMPTVKISILLFYRRIFVTKTFQTASLVLILCSLAWFIAIFCLDIWQCTPVQLQWDKTLTGTCVNDRLSFVTNGIFNIVLDTCVLLLPMPVIWKLNRSWQDRLGLMGIFALGSFIIATSIVRTVFIATYDTTDATYTIASGVTWSFCEPAVGLICGSLPTLRVFLPNYTGGTSKGNTKAAYASSQHTVDGPWPNKYQMMNGDDVPLTEGGANNLVSAQRGQGAGPKPSVREANSGLINVQREIIVT